MIKPGQFAHMDLSGTTAHAGVRKVWAIRDDGPMPGFNGITVDATEGERWEVALALIVSGEAPVRLGEIEISRGAAGPNSDGVLRMIVTVAEHADHEVATAALLRGRQVTKDAASGDARFARLLDQYGCRWEIVSDYGMGAILLGEADCDGDLIWHG